MRPDHREQAQQGIDFQAGSVGRKISLSRLEQRRYGIEAASGHQRPA